MRDILACLHAGPGSFSSCSVSPYLGDLHGDRSDGLSEYALQNRLTPFISMQNYHNAMYREVCPEIEESFVLNADQLTGREGDDAHSATLWSWQYPMVPACRRQWVRLSLARSKALMGVQTWRDHMTNRPALNDHHLVVCPSANPVKQSSTRSPRSPSKRVTA